MRDVDPGLPLFHVATLNDVVSDSLSARKINGILLGLFATLALGLAAIGLYGVLSYAVAQRTRELGIRVALGAQRAQIFRLIVGGGMKVAGIGLAIGIVAALALTRLLGSLLFGIAPNDPITFSLVILLLAAVAFLANFVPAQKAMSIDPTVALRYE